MPTHTPTLLALDFDGVLCDGLLEYFQTSWRTYCQIWQPDNQTPPPHLEPSFCRLRPVIESGWEMPVLLRALILGVSDTKILQDWSAVVRELSESEHLQPAELGKRVDTVRDEWIATDLEGWLKLHRFYPGVIERVRKTLETSTQLFIVTTKEGRFVQQLLQQQGIQLSQNQIIGKEIKRPKHETLRQLLKESPSKAVTVWFVEDRLQTLLSVEEQTDLKEVKLYLADWGYNTQAHREFATNNPRIQLLSLSQFAQDFAHWSV